MLSVLVPREIIRHSVLFDKSKPVFFWKSFVSGFVELWSWQGNNIHFINKNTAQFRDAPHYGQAILESSILDLTTTRVGNKPESEISARERPHLRWLFASSAFWRSSGWSKCWHRDSGGWHCIKFSGPPFSVPPTPTSTQTQKQTLFGQACKTTEAVTREKHVQKEHVFRTERNFYALGHGSLLHIIIQTNPSDPLPWWNPRPPPVKHSYRAQVLPQDNSGLPFPPCVTNSMEFAVPSFLKLHTIRGPQARPRDPQSRPCGFCTSFPGCVRCIPKISGFFVIFYKEATTQSFLPQSLLRNVTVLCW